MGCERGESGSVSRCVALLVEFMLLSHFDGSIDSSRYGDEMSAEARSGESSIRHDYLCVGGGFAGHEM